VFPVQTEREPEGFGGNSFGEARSSKDGLKRVQASSKTSRVSAAAAAAAAVAEFECAGSPRLLLKHTHPAIHTPHC
jgi:hypothetical protein